MASEKTERNQLLKEVIMERKRKLWNELRAELFGKLGEEYHDQFDIAMDDAERGLDDLLEDTGLSIADIRRQELTQMEEAERRLSEGTYGLCDECGEEIDTERMKVVPYTRYCVRCQERSEGPTYPPGTKT